LRTTGLLGVFLPEILEGVGQLQSEEYANDVFGHVVSTVEATPSDLILRLAGLLHDVAKPRTARRGSDGGFEFPGHEIVGEAMATEILERLRFPRKTTETVASLVRHHLINPLEVGSDADLRRFAAKVGAENLEIHLQLAEANRRARGKCMEEELKRVGALRSRITAVLSCSPPLTIQALALDGSAIMRILGVGPSPVVGEATRFLMDRVLEEPALNSGEALTEVLRDWVRSKRS
jgi:hypothetical protein